MSGAVREIMSGGSSPAQIAAFLTALRMKGESVVEIAAAAQVMRELADPVRVNGEVLDIVGTGGDGVNSFNVSTAASLVCAAAGVPVAKHGNRSVSSQSGSADVLEAAGAYLELNSDQVAICLERCSFGFMFAPRHHSAMRHAAPIRRELGIRTVFNLLGPLTNPAGATRNVIGVYDRRWLRPLAEVLQALGSTRALVVHSLDGMDELSIAAPTLACELRDGKIREFTVEPQSLGMAASPLAALKVGNAGESLAVLRSVLSGLPGAALEMVALNAGAGLYIAGRVEHLAGGIALARQILHAGQGLQCLEKYVALTQEFR